ncbi:MAG: hypothetical protein M1821_002725 [Bathelium mastoideum]|nr:MAG: hypothetical protein M1821_002725 [Bathelium mastoideum]
MVIIITWSLLLALALLSVLTLHLWRRSIMLENLLRTIAPAAHAELRWRSNHKTPLCYTTDEEEAANAAAEAPLPSYSPQASPPVDVKLQRQTTTMKTKTTVSVSVYEVPNYDYLDCDCYDGDSWASLPDEECRCLRGARKVPASSR